MESIYVKLNNVNDYETLAKDCVYMEKESSHFDQIKGEQIASITPSDCLSCSGCLTTSEELLVNKQTQDKVVRFINEKKDADVDYFVVGNELALVSMALAESKDVNGIKEYFSNKGINNLITNRLGKRLLVDLMLDYSMNFTDNKYPLFTSECPSFVLYLKKQLESHLDRFLFPFPSTGQITKLVVLESFKTNVKILGLNQCIDKKLENMNNEEVKDVDIIGTPYELLSESRVKYNFDLNINELENEYLRKGLNGSLVYSFIKKYTIKKYGLVKSEFKMCYNKVRTGFVEIYSEYKGNRLAEGIRVEGINNIVFLVNKFKTKQNNYVFAEMMACPEGCTFGSGLNKFEEIISGKTLKQKLLYEKLLKWNSFKKMKPGLIELNKDFIETYDVNEKIKTVFEKLHRQGKQHLEKLKLKVEKKIIQQNFDW